MYHRNCLECLYAFLLTAAIVNLHKKRLLLLLFFFSCGRHAFRKNNNNNYDNISLYLYKRNLLRQNKNKYNNAPQQRKTGKLQK